MSFPRRRESRVGFTLIELLVTTTILAIVALAIGSTFASGIKIYDRVRNYEFERTDALIALERIEQDIRRSIRYSSIDFSGKKEEIAFPVLLDGDAGIGRILYYRIRAKKALIREEQGYADAVSEIVKGRGEDLPVALISKLEFEYYYYDVKDGKYKWKESWGYGDSGLKKDEEKEGLMLLGIRITLTQGRTRKERMYYSRTVLIPARVSELRSLFIKGVPQEATEDEA
jgi:prepilin-type N-terminal cleavage/methylation domain-containing protein